MMSTALRTVLWGGLISGTLDLTAAIIKLAFLGISPIRVLQSISSGILGMESYQGGLMTAILGGVLHFFIALNATAVYYIASQKLGFLRKRPVPWGLLYGVAVYGFMNLLVLPLSAFPHRISLSLSGLLIIMFCVGLPISLVVSRENEKRAHARAL